MIAEISSQPTFGGLESLTPPKSTSEKPKGVSQASWHQSSSLIHGRGTHRVPFDDSVCIIGLDDSYQSASAPVIVLGRDISADGISFVHGLPLPFRYVAVSIRSAAGIQTVAARLTWCRYSRHGHYVTGGKFLQQIPLTIETPSDWETLTSG